MSRGKVLAFAFLAVTVWPVSDDGSLNLTLGLPLGPPDVPGGSDTRITLGSVGLDSRSAGADIPDRSSDAMNFIIPSERPVRRGPGLVLHIPFETGP